MEYLYQQCHLLVQGNPVRIRSFGSRCAGSFVLLTQCQEFILSLAGCEFTNEILYR